MRFMFDMIAESTPSPVIWDIPKASTRKVMVCSDECFRKLEEKFNEYPYHQLVGTDKHILQDRDSVLSIWTQVCIHSIDQFNPRFLPELKWNIKSPLVRAEPPPPTMGTSHIMGPLWRGFQHQTEQALIHNLEAAGRLSDAAQIYEDMKMYDEARKLRERERKVTVKRVEISVDLNALLQQVKDGGIVAVYRCPHCGGKVKVSKETSIDSLKHCEHCGSEIETMDLAEFLRTALS